MLLARCSCCQGRRRQVFCLHLVIARLLLFGVTCYPSDCPPCGLQLSALLLSCIVCASRHCACVLQLLYCREASVVMLQAASRQQ